MGTVRSSTAKVVYYKLLLQLYGLMGRFVTVAM
jgi:hypothetical protein